MGLKWACVWALSMASAVAQESSGSIAGTVVDAADLVIPNADVMIVNPVRLAAVDSDGKFSLANLAPGAYELRVQARGFVTKHLEIAVEAGGEKTLGRVALEVKVPPCVGSARNPRIFETPLTSGGKTRVKGSARGGAHGALRNMTVTLLLPGHRR
jgi:Carboxypeptidase regulatory-like domain